MSRLGGNSPSADTDKSNNLQGADGKVQAVVAGTNITSIDNTDPANPIINAATQSTPSPTTTKGDVIARGASVDERVAVGTDGQVMTADAASASGVKWVTPAAGGGANVTLVDTAPKGQVEAFSSSSNATRGVAYTVDTTVDISMFMVSTKGDAAATYKLLICEVSGATNIIDVILFESAVTVADALSSRHVFEVGTVTLTAGKRVSFSVTRTDGIATTAAGLSLPPALNLPPYLSHHSLINDAILTPIVTTALGDAGSPNGLIGEIGFLL